MGVHIVDIRISMTFDDGKIINVDKPQYMFKRGQAVKFDPVRGKLFLDDVSLEYRKVTMEIMSVDNRFGGMNRNSRVDNTIALHYSGPIQTIVDGKYQHVRFDSGNGEVVDSAAGRFSHLGNIALLGELDEAYGPDTNVYYPRNMETYINSRTVRLERDALAKLYPMPVGYSPSR